MCDTALVEFPSAIEAVKNSVDVQRALPKWNTDVEEKRCIEFRIELHLGDVMIEHDDLHEGEVNVDVRLEGVAVTGSICISRTV